MRFLAVAAVLALLGAGGRDCSSSSSPAAPQDAGDLVGCQSDPRADSYAANTTKMGKSGVFQFTLVSADPAPPALNNNTWTLKLADASGAPVTNATFPKISPYMPDHGHGSTATPVATPNGDGTYGITPLYFFMGGLWQVTIQAQSGSQSDSAVFSFCVAG